MQELLNPAIALPCRVILSAAKDLHRQLSWQITVVPRSFGHSDLRMTYPFIAFMRGAADAVISAEVKLQLKSSAESAALYSNSSEKQK